MIMSDDMSDKENVDLKITHRRIQVSIYEIGNYFYIFAKIIDLQHLFKSKCELSRFNFLSM